MAFRVKHVSEPASPRDGVRVLVDRLWPRGRTKASLPHHQWLREIAPSTALRQWFQHDQAKWTEFQHRYRKELAGHADDVATLRAMGARRTVTLLFGASDRTHNNAVALAAFLTDS